MTSAAATAVALEIAHLSKTFDGVRALDDVSLALRPGEIRGLLGQNGSGKSTLVKVLTGYHAPDPGARLHLHGQRVDLPVKDAGERGIAVIHQDLGLVDDLSVLDNVAVVRGFGARLCRPINERSERAKLASLQERLELELDPSAPVSTLSPADRAFVAVLRALRQMADRSDPPVLVLDEPTAYLTRSEATKVIDIMRAVCRQNGSVLFITHAIDEALSQCDALTVLVNGRVQADLPPAETTHGQLISLLLGGRALAAAEPRPPRDEGAPVRVAVCDLRGDVLEDFSVQVRAGEVVGVIGLSGMGQEELPYLLRGARPHRGGSITFSLEGGRSPEGTDGVVLVPANRARDGLWLDATAAENISLPSLRRFRIGVRGLSLRHELQRAIQLLRAFAVRPHRTDLLTRQFSGGNQQKILLAKWLQDAPQVLLLHEPTQGVDVGARAELLQLIADAAQRGAAVLICSTDHEELARICHRVIAVRHGRAVRELVGADVSESAIVAAIA